MIYTDDESLGISPAQSLVTGLPYKEVVDLQQQRSWQVKRIDPSQFAHSSAPERNEFKANAAASAR